MPRPSKKKNNSKGKKKEKRGTGGYRMGRVFAEKGVKRGGKKKQDFGDFRGVSTKITWFFGNR